MFGKAIVRGLLAAALVCCAFVAQTAAVEIDLVPVGNPGNAADDTGFGSVAKAYQIGKYEVTAGQYTEFLNAKAAVTDPYELYDTAMWNVDEGCKIQRTPVTGGYTYSVASGYANRPVNYVTFWDAARFTNWLHNDQGSGDTETGAYTLDGYNGSDGRTIARNAGAQWFLPSENEWYKAAYHKNDGVTGNYFDYPTGVDTPVPGRDMSESTNPGNNANYYDDTLYPIDSPYYTTVKGEFELSYSPYGTFDQGGNLWEWNETIVPTNYTRGDRGGSFHNWEDCMLTTQRNFNIPSTTYYTLGFRVASVPEPGSIILLVCGAIAGLIWWRLRK